MEERKARQRQPWTTSSGKNSNARELQEVPAGGEGGENPQRKDSSRGRKAWSTISGSRGAHRHQEGNKQRERKATAPRASEGRKHGEKTMYPVFHSERKNRRKQPMPSFQRIR